MGSGLRKTAIGLEIDTGAARAVEFTGKASSPNLTGLGSIVLPEGAVKEGLILEPELVGNALLKLWQNARFKERSVILGISNQGVLVRHMTVPQVAPDKLKNLIRFQAQEHLPIPIESVVLDYLVLGDAVSNSGDDQNKLEVLLVAARRDMLEKFLRCLEIARLEPFDIDVSSISLINLLPQKAKDINVALVNIANGLNSILISEGGQPRLARLGMVKISDLTDSLGYALNDINLGQINNDSKSSEILTRWIEQMAVEIRSSLTYYQDQLGASRVEGILLCGRGALIPGINEQLEDNLELPVRSFNPLDAYAPARKSMIGTDFDAIEFTISAGLGIRGLEG